MMEGGFEPAELHAIGMMASASKDLPEDFLSVEAAQELACLYAKIEPLLSDEQKGIIIGCGGILFHHGKDEFLAGLQASIILHKVGSPQ